MNTSRVIQAKIKKVASRIHNTKRPRLLMTIASLISYILYSVCFFAAKSLPIVVWTPLFTFSTMFLLFCGAVGREIEILEEENH